MYSAPLASPYGAAAASASTVTAPMVWNGQQWVPAAAPPTPTAAIPPDPVGTFTRFYHGWAHRAAELRATLAAAPGGTEADIQRRQRELEWIEYHRDNASRAAHYFNQNPGTVAPPPFELPGDPALWVGFGTAVPQKAQPQFPQLQAPQYHQMRQLPSQAQPQQPPPPAVSAGGSSEDSFKRYFSRCMGQCQTPAQKAAMKRALEQKLTALMKQQKFHGADWEREPLLVLQPGTDAVTEAPPPPPPAASVAGPTAYSTYAEVLSRNISSPWATQQPQTPLPAASLPSSLASSHSYYQAPPSGGTASSHILPEKHYYGLSLTAAQSTHSVSRADKTKKNKRQIAVDAGGGASSDYYGPSTAVSPSKRKATTVAAAIKSTKTRTRSESDHDNGDEAGFDRSRTALGDRARRFAAHGGAAAIAAASGSSTLPSDWDKYMGKGGVIGGDREELDDADYEQMKVKGTCQVVEKDYLRLTAPPRPELVRPLDVLKRHLHNLKQERSNEEYRRDYLWFCSQLKAVRQDCTVQHIRDAFAVDVYETHARIALEEGDLNEYNQCQTQLKELYSLMKKEGNSEATANRCEFTAYRLLYYIFLSCNSKYTGGSSDLFQLMDSLTTGERNDPGVIHALQVRVAVADIDYHAFFCLYKTAPNLGRLLLDRIAPTVRNQGLLRFYKAYRPSIDTLFVLKELGFDVESKRGRRHGTRWLESCGCLLSEDKKTWNTKDTMEVHESHLEEKKSLI